MLGTLGSGTLQREELVDGEIAAVGHRSIGHADSLPEEGRGGARAGVQSRGAKMGVQGVRGARARVQGCRGATARVQGSGVQGCGGAWVQGPRRARSGQGSQRVRCRFKVPRAALRRHALNFELGTLNFQIGTGEPARVAPPAMDSDMESDPVGPPLAAGDHRYLGREMNRGRELQNLMGFLESATNRVLRLGCRCRCARCDCCRCRLRVRTVRHASGERLATKRPAQAVSHS